MKYRYLIYSCDDEFPVGTNNKELADEYSCHEMATVVDCVTGDVLMDRAANSEYTVKEAQPIAGDENCTDEDGSYE